MSDPDTLVDRLLGFTYDWNGSEMADEAPALTEVNCGLLREAALRICQLEGVGGQPGSPSPNPPSASYQARDPVAMERARPKLRSGGYVGFPRDGERVCETCEGTGHNLERQRDRWAGCDVCEGTGVLPITDPTSKWAGNQIGEL